MSSTPKPTLKEISAMTGVSTATVSRALSDPDKVKFSTRRKIELAIREYRMDGFIAKTKTIGVIIPDITNQFFSSMLSGIKEIALAQGYTAFIADSDGSEKNEEAIIQQFIDIDVEGIIIIPALKATPAAQELIRDHVIPVVYLDRDPEIGSVSVITSDNYTGMYQAATYLSTLGHRRFLYIGGVPGTSSSADRFQGFADALSRYGLGEDDWIHISADFNFYSAYNQVRNLDIDFTAVVAANDLMALGAIRALSEKGASVPDDVSVIGFDDIPSAEFSQLTTIKQPYTEMGRNAAFLLLSQMKEPLGPKNRVILPPQIVFRSTCSIAKHIREKAAGNPV